MKLFYLFLIFFAQLSFGQTIDEKTEKDIIKQTLSQYLDTNPNSIASYLKNNKGYENTYFLVNSAIILEDDLDKKQQLKNDLEDFYQYVDSISVALEKKKITVRLSDFTINSYKYLPKNTDVRLEKNWQNIYSYLLEDFKDNNLARFSQIIGEEYIDLIKKQIHYQGNNTNIQPKELDYSFYEYEKNKLECEDEFCINADKIYHLVFNENQTKACYLFSFKCQENEICRSFIFIKKENNEWIYVDEYPSWIVEDF